VSLGWPCKTSRWEDARSVRANGSARYLVREYGPAEFPDPELVDFNRNPNRHRAFAEVRTVAGIPPGPQELRVAMREFTGAYRITRSSRTSWSLRQRCARWNRCHWSFRCHDPGIVDVDRCTAMGAVTLRQCLRRDEVATPSCSSGKSPMNRAQAVAGERNCPEGQSRYRRVTNNWSGSPAAPKTLRRIELGDASDASQDATDTESRAASSASRSSILIGVTCDTSRTVASWCPATIRSRALDTRSSASSKLSPPGAWSRCHVANGYAGPDHVVRPRRGQPFPARNRFQSGRRRR